MAAISGGAVLGGEGPGPAGIGVGDSGDRDIGEAGQDIGMASGDISGTDDADTRFRGHDPAYATCGPNQTDMFEGLGLGQRLGPL
ncbi:hypothetical protein ACFMQL_21295 [Nonomuraea fastidiosa]|uniref:hypothetical protein n=1 Tax=Nonomuraea TaxID=83681 RepID=UPI00343873EE